MTGRDDCMMVYVMNRSLLVNTHNIKDGKRTPFGIVCLLNLLACTEPH